jgi:diacylglycerol kinase
MWKYLQKRLYSFWYAGKGLAYLIKTEAQFQVHICLATLVIWAGFWCAITRFEWLCVVLSIALVMTAEALNTALEVLVDWLSPEKRVEAGKIKDIAAGAVLLASLGALAVGLCVFLPKLI